jgi:microcystin degradation protein MlrC
MVVLGLHGAMVADGYDDYEGDLLAHVRAIVGPSVVVGAELDPRNRLTAAMTGNALLEAEGIEMMLITLRNQALDTDLFTQQGCDLGSKKIIVKSS